MSCCSVELRVTPNKPLTPRWLQTLGSSEGKLSPGGADGLVWGSPDLAGLPWGPSWVLYAGWNCRFLVPSGDLDKVPVPCSLGMCAGTWLIELTSSSHCVFCIHRSLGLGPALPPWGCLTSQLSSSRLGREGGERGAGTL